MGYVCINLFPLIDVSTIVGLDICPPSDAAERVPLYHRASPLNHQSPHTRIDTAFSPGIYPRHGCSLWIYPPTHWVYTRISPFALVIYEDNTHIKPSIGHSINTGTHMCICGSACHSWFLALTDTDNCFPLTASGGRSKKNTTASIHLPLKRGARIFDRIEGMCTTSMVECLFFCLRDECNFLSLRLFHLS